MELTELVHRCYAIIEIISRSSEPDQEGFGISALVRQLREVVEECERKGRRAELRTLVRELEGMSRELEPGLRAEVDALLASQGTGGLDVIAAKELEKVREIIARGQIAHPSEHETVRGWYDDPISEADPHIRGQAETLLFHYERRSG